MGPCPIVASVAKKGTPRREEGTAKKSLVANIRRFSPFDVL